MISQKDIEFGKRIVSLGLITQPHLADYLSLLEEFHKRGQEISLKDFLIQTGHIQPSQLHDAIFEGENEEEEKNTTSQGIEGKQIGRYKLIEAIGKGGMGRVYKAYDSYLTRTVALKVLISEENETDVSRFLQEAKTTALLKHPNIVSIYDFGEERGQHFFTMEMVDGVSLQEVLKDSSLSIRRGVELMIKISQGMDYAHREGIVHRDIKPGNVMLDREGEPKIMDFGLAKSMKADKKFSKTGVVMGTLHYMPPEQAEGKSREIDVRSDIYSLGALFYEMLTGRPPFVGSTVSGILEQILNREPLPPSRVKRTVPKELDPICLKALEKKKEDRYQTAREFADDLSCFARGGTVATDRRLTWKRFLRRVGQHRGPIMGLTALTSVLVMLCVFFWGQEKKNLPKEEAPKHFVLTSIFPREVFVGENIRCKVKVKSEEKNAVENLRIRLFFSPEMVLREKSEAWDVRLWSGEEKEFDYDLLAPKSGKYEHRIQLLFKGIPIQEKNVVLEVKGEKYGLPEEVWGKCVYEHEGKKMLDFSCLYWERLSPALQQRYAAAYQEGYAVEIGHPLEKKYAVGKTEIAMRLIPPGRFWMGSPLLEPGRQEDETRHRVVLSHGYYIGKTEISQEQWRSVMGSAPSYFTNRKTNLPVERVSWYDCRKFCEKTGLKLPTEAQWEFACRGGCTGLFYWGNEWDRNDRINSASYWARQNLYNYYTHVKWNFPKRWRIFGAGTTPCGTFPPNAFGIHDMLGNLWEWGADFFAPYGEGDRVDPKGPSVGITRVLRGGGFSDGGGTPCRNADRFYANPGSKDLYYGFRVALDLR